MLAEGGYLWNSGMFMFSAAAFLQECEALAPEIAIAARAAVADAVIDPDFVRLDRTAFAAAPSISVDYAIFEKTARSAVVPVSFHWSDLGSWDGLWKVSPRDLANNAVRGAVTLHRVSNSLVLSDHAHIAVDGLDDIAVIATPDAIYVGRLSGASDIGVIVKTLRGGRETVDLTRIHETIRHPRGGHAATRPGERFQVKRLIVKPGRKPGLRKPRRRGLHWVVMRGTAEVTLNGTLTRLGKNQSIHLPPGCSHRLANPGRTDLELIEIETGSS
jgi:mannose-1-phosphate guanylyltransferase